MLALSEEVEGEEVSELARGRGIVLVVGWGLGGLVEVVLCLVGLFGWVVVIWYDNDIDENFYGVLSSIDFLVEMKFEEVYEPCRKSYLLMLFLAESLKQQSDNTCWTMTSFRV